MQDTPENESNNHSNVDSNKQNEEGNIMLSSGELVVSDWSPVWVIQDPYRLASIRDQLLAVSQVNDHKKLSGPWNGILRFEQFADEWNTPAIQDHLSVSEFNAIAAALCNTGAATEYKRDSTYSSYTFAVKKEKVKQVFDQWVIAASNITARDALEHHPDPSVELVATLPPEAKTELRHDFDRIDLSLRSLITGADNSIRVAAPYLDPEEDVIQDIAALPEQGISTFLITREATGTNAGSETRKALEQLAASIPNNSLSRFHVSDLYERSMGRQKEAVHAKVVIIDEEECYLGSANFTSNSLDSNFEIGIILNGEYVKKIVALFDQMFERGTPVQL